jgi:hypothetical protein
MKMGYELKFRCSLGTRFLNWTKSQASSVGSGFSFDASLAKMLPVGFWSDELLWLLLLG